MMLRLALLVRFLPRRMTEVAVVDELDEHLRMIQNGCFRVSSSAVNVVNPFQCEWLYTAMPLELPGLESRGTRTV